MTKTTIQLSTETKALLDDHKQASETYEDVVRRLAGATDAQMWTEDEIRSMARAEAKDMIRRFG